jgi:hypothetical protein
MKKAMTLSSAIAPVLATEQAAEDDQTASAMHIEHARFERAVLDFEAAIRGERDRLQREHLGNVRSILAEAAE